MKLIFVPISKIKSYELTQVEQRSLQALPWRLAFVVIMYDSSIFFINYDSTILKMFVYIQMTISLKIEKSTKNYI